jgi:hypothetical protein
VRGSCLCLQGGNHVCFRGPLGELPKGDDGSYGTSVTWIKAMDPSSDILIAYKQVCVCCWRGGRGEAQERRCVWDVCGEWAGGSA